MYVIHLLCEREGGKKMDVEVSSKYNKSEYQKK